MIETDFVLNTIQDNKGNTKGVKIKGFNCQLTAIGGHITTEDMRISTSTYDLARFIHSIAQKYIVARRNIDWLDDRIEFLEKENKKLGDAIETQDDVQEQINNNYVKTIKGLRAAVKQLTIERNALKAINDSQPVTLEAYKKLMDENTELKKQNTNNKIFNRSLMEANVKMSKEITKLSEEHESLNNNVNRLKKQVDYYMDLYVTAARGLHIE